MRSNQYGSLLIHLGICLAVILLLLSLSMPGISWTHRFLLRTELEKLYTIFHYLQQRAIAINEDQQLIFDISNNQLLGDIHNEKLSNAIQFGFLHGALGPPSHPTKQITSPITFKKNTAIFYADGTIAAGTVYLVDREKKYMYALTSPISQISFIRMYYYQNGSWILIK